MSDRLEKAKEQRRTGFTIEHDRFDGRYIKFKDADKFIEVYNWLITEVERLRERENYWRCAYYEWEIVSKKQIESLQSQLEVVEKERDELKSGFDERVRVIEMQLEDKNKLEAENAQLKFTIETGADAIYKLDKKLTASEKRVEELEREAACIKHEWDWFDGNRKRCIFCGRKE